MNAGKPERTAIVTGAAGGIGRVLTEALLGDGHRVVAFDARADALDELRSHLSAASDAGRVAFVAGDVSRESDCAEAVRTAHERFGGLEIVVNNAAIGVSSLRPDAETVHPTIEELTPEVWSRFFAVNVHGPFLLTRAALPSLKAASWGRIVNNTTSFLTMLRVLPYGACKAALESMSAIWAKELAGTGITVTVLVPGGPTDTPFISDAAGIPRDQMLRPEVMAAPMRWLASDESQTFTGRRIVAGRWPEGPAPAEAAGRASAPIGWPDLAQDVIWPGGAP